MLITLRTDKTKLSEMSANLDEEVNVLEAEELAHALAGAGGGALSMALTYPLVTISTKLQAEAKSKKEEKRTAWQVIEDVWQKEGLTGLYSGLESAVYGMAIANFIYYYFYESAGKSIQKLRRKTQLNAVESMITGAIAGSATAIASNPIWVANTRMTVTKSEKSTFTMMMHIIRDDGVPALFKGLKPALILVTNPILQYTVYEQLKNLILGFQGGQSAILAPSWAFLLGAIGKLIATSVTYPYITLKTRKHIEGDKNVEKTTATDTDKKSSASALEIIKTEGISGLYSGIGYKLTQSILTAAFLFYFKEGLMLWAIKALKLLRQFNRSASKERRIVVSKLR